MQEMKIVIIKASESLFHGCILCYIMNNRVLYSNEKSLVSFYNLLENVYFENYILFTYFKIFMNHIADYFSPNQVIYRLNTYL